MASEQKWIKSPGGLWIWYNDPNNFCNIPRSLEIQLQSEAVEKFRKEYAELFLRIDGMTNAFELAKAEARAEEQEEFAKAIIEAQLCSDNLDELVGYLETWLKLRQTPPRSSENSPSPDEKKEETCECDFCHKEKPVKGMHSTGSSYDDSISNTCEDCLNEINAMPDTVEESPSPEVKR